MPSYDLSLCRSITHPLALNLPRHPPRDTPSSPHLPSQTPILALRIGCWFCLSNEKDLHLVASIATESFVSMDKAGVNSDHCQVVPVEHVPSFAAGPYSPLLFLRSSRMPL